MFVTFPPRFSFPGNISLLWFNLIILLPSEIFPWYSNYSGGIIELKFCSLSLTNATQISLVARINHLPPARWSPFWECFIASLQWLASQITSFTIVYWTVYSSAEQRKHQSSASLAFVWGIQRWPVNSSHKWPLTRKIFPFDDVIVF